MNDQVQVQSQMATKPDAPAGWTYVKKGDKYVLVPNAEVAAETTTTASKLLMSASIEEFLDLFYPLKIKEIEVGDRVYNRSTKRFGHVIRAAEGSFRVETDKKIGTYWEQELEVR